LNVNPARFNKLPDPNSRSNRGRDTLMPALTAPAPAPLKSNARCWVPPARRPARQRKFASRSSRTRHARTLDTRASTSGRGPSSSRRSKACSSGSPRPSTLRVRVWPFTIGERLSTGVFDQTCVRTARPASASPQRGFPHTWHTAPLPHVPFQRDAGRVPPYQKALQHAIPWCHDGVEAWPACSDLGGAMGQAARLLHVLRCRRMSIDGRRISGPRLPLARSPPPQASAAASYTIGTRVEPVVIV
jgi:hypothetical protein